MLAPHGSPGRSVCAPGWSRNQGRFCLTTQSLMHYRLTLPTVAVLSLLAGLATGLIAPRSGNNPALVLPDEPQEFGQNVPVIRTDPALDSPAGYSMTGELPSGRRWVF